MYKMVIFIAIVGAAWPDMLLALWASHEFKRQVLISV